ncbi:MAG: DUF1080 domain-containing protein [Verrucomicrobia bacterium]|nr:MAG: DUF1080 domain-containing protein [Verrucomicrobiota bacterium]
MRPARPATEEEILARAAAQPVAPVAGEGWQSLFDGKSLTGWRVTDFSAGGEVTVGQGMILCRAGEPFTGISTTNFAAKVDYEISLEAMRVSGADFFCGLTFPVRESFCSLILGGWGGSVVGLSSLDDEDASENETTQIVEFESGRWYHVQLRVTEQRVEAWIEQKKVVDAVIAGRKVSLRPGEIELSRPLGLCCWSTTAAYRAVQVRPVLPERPR